MSRATETQLADLHGAVFTTMMEELDRQRARATIDPEFSVSPQLLTQITKFLKDNGISSESVKPLSDKLQATVSAPINFDDLDDDFPVNGFN